MDTRLPVLSVITPVLNGGERFRRCVQSVWELSEALGGGVEHIIADGGSSDGTVECAKASQRQEGSPIRRIIGGPDSGQSQAINRGVAASQGTWVAWLNADDWYEPSAAEVVSILGRPPFDAVDVVVGHCRFVDEQGRAVFKPVPPALDSVVPQLLPLSHWFAGRSIVQPETFIRRSAFESVGGLDEQNHWAMDHDLWIRLHENGACFREAKGLVASQLVHSGQKTADNLSVAKAIAANIERCMARGRVSVPDDVSREVSELCSRISDVEEVVKPGKPAGIVEPREQARGLLSSVEKRVPIRGAVLSVGACAHQAIAAQRWSDAQHVRSSQVLRVQESFELVVLDCAQPRGGIEMEVDTAWRSVKSGGWLIMAGIKGTQDVRATRAEVMSSLASRITWQRRPWNTEQMQEVRTLLRWMSVMPSCDTGVTSDHRSVLVEPLVPRSGVREICEMFGTDWRGLVGCVSLQKR